MDDIIFSRCGLYGTLYVFLWREHIILNYCIGSNQILLNDRAWYLQVQGTKSAIYDCLVVVIIIMKADTNNHINVVVVVDSLWTLDTE